MAKGKKTGGRKAGTPNKITATLTEAIDAAFNAVGGAQYLEGVAKSDPKAFCALLGRRLPKDISIDAKGNITVHVTTGVPQPEAQ